MEVEPQVLSERTNDGDSLVSRLDPDTSQNEQTWPSEEEMQGLDASSVGEGSLPPALAGTTPKAVKKVRVPKGTSTYQAAWIVDDDDEGEDDEARSDNGSEEEEMEELEMDKDGFRVPALPGKDGKDVEDDDDEAMSTSGSRRSVTFQDLDVEEEGKQCVLAPDLSTTLLLIGFTT